MPERQPVECWQPIQSGSEHAFEFTAKYGIGGGSAEGGAFERHMLGFQAIDARWLDTVRPSRRPLRGLLRMKKFLRGIEESPHAESL